MAISRKRKGRPPETLGDAKRHPLNMRTTKAMRDDLEQAARQSGRSLAQEVEFRLEWSFLDEQERAVLEMHHMFRGARNFAIALALARIASEIGDQVFAPWTDNEHIYRKVREAFDTFLDGIAPPPGAAATGGRFVDPDAKGKRSGRAIAEYWLKFLPLATYVRRRRLRQGKLPFEPSNLREIAYRVAPELVPLIGRSE